MDMKQHLNEILYVALLGMAFTFFAFVDDLGLTHSPRVRPVNVQCSEPAKVESSIKDYTYSPFHYVNGFN
jgi:hypothetical protein